MYFPSFTFAELSIDRYMKLVQRCFNQSELSCFLLVQSDVKTNQPSISLRDISRAFERLLRVKFWLVYYSVSVSHVKVTIPKQIIFFTEINQV